MVSEITQVELVIALHDISMCWEIGFKKVVCFSDSSHALHLIREGAQSKLSQV